nr:lysosome membrane protein 2-like [Danaus plexippus plexippus]
MLEDTEKTSASLMPREEKAVIVPGNGVGKFLIREDTILAGLPGCAGCGRAQLTCAGVKRQWSALCWGKQSNKKYYTMLVILSATFALSFIGTIFFCFTNTLNDAILSNMVIKNNTVAYSLWRRPSVQPLMKVHVFNYTNWERVRSGLDERLRVQDVGPFIYSLPLLGVIANVLHLPTLGQITVQSTLSFADHNEAFLKLPVQRFLWGYDDRIMDLARPFLSIGAQFRYDKFGLLVSVSIQAPGCCPMLRVWCSFRAHNKLIIADKSILDTVGWISESYLRMHSVRYQKPTVAVRSITSSDGTIFPPSLLNKKTRLFVFNSNMCRRLPFDYLKDVEMEQGIRLMRYVMPSNVFDDPQSNPDNQCYCDVDSGTCPPRGIINVTACSMGAPLVASFPHFYRGDPKLYEDIQGLSPNGELHDSFIDIHPTLGIALNGRSSLQLNIQVKKSSVFGALSFLPEGIILPIAWIEMALEELPESLQSLVYHGTFSTAAVQLGLAMFCSVTLLISSICMLMMIITRRRKPCATLKIIPADIELKT